MGKIKIVGHTGTFDYETVVELVIKLKDEFYFKSDTDNLVKIKVDGKTKLYRKANPLICYTLNKTYNLKSNCHKLANEIFLEKSHPDTVKLIDGAYTHISFVVNINGIYYLKSDERITKLYNGGYGLKENSTLLSSKYYGNNIYIVPSEEHTAVTLTYELILQEDARKITFLDEHGIQQFSTLHRKIIGGNYVNNVFAGFKDRTNPQLDRIETAYAKSSEIISVGFMGYFVLRGMEAVLEQQCLEISLLSATKSTETIRAKINSKFSDLDETENKAKIISTDYRIWGGKEHLFGNSDKHVISKKFDKLGGLGYAFGVEIETSAGIIPSKYGNEVGFLAVGDRSIGSAEYVTSVLQGNKGLEHVEAIMQLVKEHTLVDDRCSIHVHVGSPITNGATNWDVNFNTNFAMAAIKLGCDIEEDLYRILPKSRHPYNRHCHSIQRFRNVNQDNIRNYLAAYVFGPQESWGSNLNFNNYIYGASEYNKRSKLSNWCGGRYKWLNLVRAYSSCSSPTIEYRIFSPTTNFDKVYNYILLSLAITHVANTAQAWVMKEKRSLIDVIKLAFKKSPLIADMLINFIEERTILFSRKVVYTLITPDRIVSTEPTVNKPIVKLAEIA